MIGRRRGRAGLTLLGAVAAVLVPVAAHAGGDCGGGDTPPAYHLSSGQTCAGSLEGEPNMTGWGERYEDRFTYAATLDDLVTMRLTTTNYCIGLLLGDLPADAGQTYASTRYNDGQSIEFLAQRSGTLSLTVVFARGGFGATLPAPATRAACHPPKTYSIVVTVTPNDRPSIVSVTGPSTPTAGVPARYTLTVTDPDGNLRRAGAWTPSATGHTYAWLSGSSATATFDLPIDTSGSISFVAEDTTCVDTDYGERCASASSTMPVTVVQNDCGSGADAVLLDVALPLACAKGHLLFWEGDPKDSFTFTVPEGSTRVWVAFSKLHGHPGTNVRLIAPGGASTTATDAGVSLTGPPGAWRLDLERTYGYAVYSLSVRALGPPSPPALAVSPTSAAIHQGDSLTISAAATDPNALSVFYTVVWGDGATSRLPSSGAVPSGTSVTATRSYPYAKSSFSILVRAENEEGLRTEVVIPVAVTPHNDCAAGADLGPGWGASRPEAGEECAGDLGYVLNSVGTVDDGDAYRLPSAGRAERVTIRVAAAPGLTARLHARNARIVTPLGEAGGHSTTGSQTVTVELLAPTVRNGNYGVVSYVVVERLAGAGAYTISATYEPQTP